MTVADAVDIGDGVRMPLLGLGTWQARRRAAYDAVVTALHVGYRHVDTATAYRNEDRIGDAIAESGVPREEIFVTTKLPPDRAGEERATIGESLDALRLDHVDLWLIHWPPRGGARPDVWERMIELHEEGLARQIGVSNYSVEQLDELHSATGRMPAVNQIEWGPALHDSRILDAHVTRGVRLEGYSPLRSTSLRDHRLRRIAEAHGVSPAQVVIRWHLEHGIVVIPKSTHAERIGENADVFGFHLAPDEIAELDGLREARRD